MSYVNGYLLTEKMLKEIPDFFKLVEHARINGETLALARAVEKRFGRGSYKKIFSTGEEDALKVLQELS